MARDISRQLSAVCLLCPMIENFLNAYYLQKCNRYHKWFLTMIVNLSQNLEWLAMKFCKPCT